MARKAKKAKITDKQQGRTFSYLRVSTNGQDIEKDKADVLKLAEEKGFDMPQFIEEKVSGKVTWKERKIFNLIQSLKEGDKLIVPELSRLGRSMLEVMEILSIAKTKGVAIYDVRNGWELNGSLQSKVMAMCFSIAAEIERDLISSRTKAGLRAARAKGVLLGRPKGIGKSKLDPFRPEIEGLLANGSTKTFIAQRYGCTSANLLHWLKRHDIGGKQR